MNEALAFAQVILIDICLSGDNAIVIGMAAAGLTAENRRRSIQIGIAIAIALRIAFTTMAVTLLTIQWVSLAGGVLLLWVCWKLLRDLRASESGDDAPRAAPSLWAAVYTIAVADVSMSLDNVLAVAAASRDHELIMAFGLLLSIGLMAFCADITARALNRWPSISYGGLALIFYIACHMVAGTVVDLSA